MFEVIKKLNEIVIDGYKEKVHSAGPFILSETNKNASCKQAKLRARCNDFLILKFDKKVKDEDGFSIEDPIIFFKKGIARTKPEYLVFYPYEKDSVTKLFIFICN